MIEQANGTLPSLSSAGSSAGPRTLALSNMPELEYLFEPRAECMQLSLDPFAATATVLNTGNIRLVAHRSKTSFRVRRQRRPGRLTIGYANSTCAVVQGGRQHTFGDMIVVGEDVADLALLGPSDFVWLDVDIAAMGRESLLSFLPPLRRGTVLKPADGRRARELRGYIVAIQQMCVADPLLVRDPAMRSQLQESLLERLVRALAGAQENVDTKAAGRTSSLVQQVERFMWDNVEEPITLQRICEATNSSARSLIYCFNRAFGLGPIAYLKICRLDAAHRRLIETRGRVRIADVAADFGFWHMGHFSADYKRMFGSTASQTIEAARARFGECAS